MTALDLAEEFDCHKVGLRRCACGSAPVMHYTPGATLIWCGGCKDFVFGLPDWQPRATAENWNTQRK